MEYQVERVAECVECGEGPFWDVQTQCLYYVDMVGNTIHKYNPSKNEHTQASIGVSTSFIFPLEGTTDKFVISMERDIVIVTWDGVGNSVSNIEKIAEVDTDEESIGNRLNDGKIDPTGTLWTGTMENNLSSPQKLPKCGSIYSLGKDRNLKQHVGGIRVSNGFAWSNDLKSLYYIDSFARTVDAFDLNVNTQTITNRRSIFNFKTNEVRGFPDGQTIDVDGNLWVAAFNDSKVIQIDPRRPDTLLRIVNIPSKQVTSVAFGGENLDELYVTTGRFKFTGQTIDPLIDGALYKVTGLGVKGYGSVRATF